ncbi:MAG: hypothetical protein PWP50_503 [Synergistaceae bacterium]|jgi:hypothetical protein|nr:hypothetical protein [Synergistaceae bacterium]
MGNGGVVRVCKRENTKSSGLTSRVYSGGEGENVNVEVRVRVDVDVSVKVSDE